MPMAVATLGTPNMGMGIAIAPVSMKVLTMGKPTAHRGTMVTPHPGPPKVHPMNPIILNCSTKVLVNGMGVAHTGSICACLHPMLFTQMKVLTN
jgi:uncharacterized Zn-binding protein involved in type VI secretion